MWVMEVMEWLGRVGEKWSSVCYLKRRVLEGGDEGLPTASQG